MRTTPRLSFLAVLAAVACLAAGAPGFAGNLSLTWAPATDEMTAGYDVELLDADGHLLQVLDAGEEPRIYLSGLEDGRLYRVRLRPYDRFGNRARKPSAELVTFPAPEVREIEGEIEAGRRSWVSLHGVNFADGAEVILRPRGVRVLEATVVRHDLLVLEVRADRDLVLRPGDVTVVNPVRKAEEFFARHPEVLDLDGSGRVDEADLGPVESLFGVTRGDPLYRLRWDPNGDGVIDGEDRALLEEHLRRAREDRGQGRPLPTAARDRSP